MLSPCARTWSCWLRCCSPPADRLLVLQRQQRRPEPGAAGGADRDQRVPIRGPGCAAAFQPGPGCRRHPPCRLGGRFEYQTAVQLSHYETVDGTPTGAPATTNPYYVAVQFTDRIRAADSGLDLYPGTTVIYSEGLTSAAGPPTIAALWRHRLPPPAAHPLDHRALRLRRCRAGRRPIWQRHHSRGGGWRCSAIELAGATTVPITASWWPANALTNVPYSFSTDHEAPDPIGLQEPERHPQAVRVARRPGRPTSTRSACRSSSSYTHQPRLGHGHREPPPAGLRGPAAGLGAGGIRQ